MITILCYQDAKLILCKHFFVYVYLYNQSQIVIHQIKQCALYNLNLHFLIMKRSFSITQLRKGSKQSLRSSKHAQKQSESQLYREQIKQININKKINQLQKRKKQNQEKLANFKNDQRILQVLKKQVAVLKTQNDNLKLKNRQLLNKIAKYQFHQSHSTILDNFQIESSSFTIKQLANHLSRNTSHLKNAVDSKRTKVSSRVLTQTNQLSRSIAKLQQCKIGKLCQIIEQTYEDYMKKQKIPKIQQFQLIVKDFIQQFGETRLKIKLILDKIKDQFPKAKILKLSELVQLYKIPQIYKNNPNMLLNQLSKQKIMSRNYNASSRKNSNDKKNDEPDGDQQKLQELILKISKNSKILKKLKANLVMREFLKKFQS